MRFFVSFFLFALAIVLLGFALVGYWPLGFLSVLCSLAGAANALCD